MLEEDEDGWARTVRFVLDAGALRDTYTLASPGTSPRTAPVPSPGPSSRRASSRRWTAPTAGCRGAGTAVTYELSVEVKMPMLGMLRRKAEKTIIDTALKELKKRAEG